MTDDKTDAGNSLGKEAAAPAEARTPAVSNEGSRTSTSLRHAKADTLRRRADIARWLARGVPARVIIARSVERHGVKRRTAEGDLAYVREKLSAQFDAELPHVRAELVGMLREIIANAMASGEWRAAVAAIREMSDLCGFKSAAVNVNVVRESPHMSLLDETPVQRANRLRELRAKALAAAGPPEGNHQ